MIHSKERENHVDSGASSHMMVLSSLKCKEKKTIRRSIRILHIQTANGIVVSDTQAKVCMNELWRLSMCHIWRNFHRRCYRWEDYAMSLVFLFVGVRRNSRLSKGKKVIVLMVAVTEQKAVPSIEFSTAKGNLEREHTRSRGQQLDLFKPSTEG